MNEDNEPPFWNWMRVGKIEPLQALLGFMIVTGTVISFFLIIFLIASLLGYSP